MILSQLSRQKPTNNKDATIYLYNATNKLENKNI